FRLAQAVNYALPLDRREVTPVERFQASLKQEAPHFSEERRSRNENDTCSKILERKTFCRRT
ncbi:MAG: hypothetical protein QXS76_03660, partial [Candidatus Bathyarchaeia archaeon]